MAGPSPDGSIARADATPPPGRLRLALRRDVVRRGLFYAVVVGSILIAINHGDALLAGEITGRRVLKMGVTVMVPYLVSTFSSVGALMKQQPRR